MTTSIRFLTNEAGKTEGLAYAGFETFRGSPYTSCARETGQNSRDAARGQPVRVEFSLRRIPRPDIPFADQLARSITCCLEAPQNDKTEAHLSRALSAITADEVRVLEIADYNTTGLTGPIDDPLSVFTALVKGDGITNKPDETSAGSFGIGKNAAFAVSAMQTVLYSTCYQDTDSEEVKFAAQGRLRLISHTDGDRKLSAEGYWGNPDFRAVESPSQVPAWLRRDEIGTSIFSVGFIEQDHWAERMTLSLATNFFVAINRGDIEFSVGGAPITRASLDSVLESSDLEELATKTDQSAELGRARRLLLCTRSDAASHHTISIPGLGDFNLHLLVTPGLPREIHVLRNGIYITDNFAKFSQPLRQFPGTREFTAVLEPATTPSGKGPSSLLKQLENPAHDAFEPDRITDEAARETARRQIKSLVSKARKIIRDLAKIEDVARSQLDELSRMFADTGATRDPGREDTEQDPDNYTYTQPRRSRRRNASGTPGSGRGTTRGGAGRQQRGARTGRSSRTGKPAGGATAVPLTEIRSIVPGDSARVRRVWFTPGADGEISLAIMAAGLTDDVELRIEGGSSGSVTSGRVQLQVRSGEREVVEVTLAEPFDGPIELVATRFSPAAAEAV